MLQRMLKLETKFQISSHKLKIETGRYIKQVEIVENVDEIHFFDLCPYYYNKRANLYDFII